MKKNLFFLTCIVLSSGVSLVNAMEDAAAAEPVAAAMTKEQKRNQAKMVKAELLEAASTWDGAHSGDDEDAEVARQVADFCRTLSSSRFPGSKKAITRKLQKQVAECDRHAAAFEGGHTEFIAGLEAAREHLKNERADARAGKDDAREVAAIDADLNANLGELSKHVIGHLRGAASIYSHALLQVLDQVGTSLSQIHALLGGTSAEVEKEGDDEEEWNDDWEDAWGDDEEEYKSTPVIGEDEKRTVIAKMAGRALHDLRELRKSVAGLLEKGAGRDHVHSLASAVVKRLPEIHAVAKKDADVWKDYFDLFAETEAGDRLNDKTDAERGWHTARGRAAHLYLQRQRLESIAASLNELRGKVSDDAVYERLMNELGKIKTGDVAASTLQLLVSRAEAIQRFTSTGPLRASCEDMTYRMNACKNLTPYINVMNASVAVLVSRLAPGVFTAGKKANAEAAGRARDRHTAAAAPPKVAAPAAESASPADTVDGESTGDSGDDDSVGAAAV